MTILRNLSPLGHKAPPAIPQPRIQASPCSAPEAPDDFVQLSSPSGSASPGWGKKALMATALAVALATSGCATHGGYYGTQDNVAAVVIGAGVGAIIGGTLADHYSPPIYPSTYGYGYQYRPVYNPPTLYQAPFYNPCYICY
ncbi:hypothetical protein IV102_03245 [bacterium]|nr:hypothetical protein [bacterium]